MKYELEKKYKYRITIYQTNLSYVLINIFDDWDYFYYFISRGE